MSKQSEAISKNTIYGYSERGIINSLIFSIGEDRELMNSFLKLTQIDIGNPKYHTILLEQSFSDFGDADLVVILHYDQSQDKKVLFFEAKVKTSLSSWNISYHYDKFINKIKYDGYSSNLFYQLYFKKLLMDNLDDVITNKNIPSNFRNRKIGANPVVFKAVNKLIGFREAYYIGLIPTPEEDIKNFNKKVDYDIHYLSWETVYDFCKKKQLEKVKEIFDYNGDQIFKQSK